MVNIKTKSYEYRVSKLTVGEDGKADCKAQKLFKDGWGNVENKRVRRLLAEIALKRQRGCGRVEHRIENKKRAS